MLTVTIGYQFCLRFYLRRYFSNYQRLPTKYNNFNALKWLKFYILIPQMKAIFLSLLIILASSQIIITNSTSYPTSNETNSTQITTSDGFQDIPLDNLDQIYVYLVYQTLTFYPQLYYWSLSAIKQKSQPVTDTNYIIYVFEMWEMDVDNNFTTVVNETIITILGTDNMTFFAFFDGTSAYYSNYTQDIIALPTRVENGSQVTVTGGITYPVGGPTVGDINKLDDEATAALNFARQRVPKLKQWILVSFEQQIVAGLKYKFQLKDPDAGITEVYTVWSQPWMKFLQITLPDGTQITNAVSEVPKSNSTKSAAADTDSKATIGK